MIATTLCYIEKNHKILLLYRNKKEDNSKGKWIGVGGKREEGETVVECMKREVLEETGLTVLRYHLHGVIKFIAEDTPCQDMYLFSVSEFSGTLKERCDEGELSWVEKDKVLNLPTWEGDRYFLEPLLQGVPSINKILRYEGYGENEHLVEVIDREEEVVIEKGNNLEYPHGFSTRYGGVSEGIFKSLNLGMNRGDEPLHVAENWRRFLKGAGVPEGVSQDVSKGVSQGVSEGTFVSGRQVHGKDIYVAGRDDRTLPYQRKEPILADGFVTAEKGVPICIFTADCVPLLLEDHKHQVIGAIHCGWRSTVADIEGEAIQKMKELGAKPEDIFAAIGPAIDRCCFEVGEEVIRSVKELLGEESTDLYDPHKEGKYYLDLRGVVQRRLEQLGVPGGNIERVGGCTKCNPERYWSHRYTGGERGSQASMICMA